MEFFNCEKMVEGKIVPKVETCLVIFLYANFSNRTHRRLYIVTRVCVCVCVEICLAIFFYANF